MSIHVLDEANRCLHCKAPQCQKGCPSIRPSADHRDAAGGQAGQAGRTLFGPSPLCATWCAAMKTSARATVCWAKGAPVHFPPLKLHFQHVQHQDGKGPRHQRHAGGHRRLSSRGRAIAVILAQYVSGDHF